MDFSNMYDLSKGLSVLFAEDDDILREKTYKVLQNFFLHIDLAVDGKDALQKYQNYYDESNKYYDIVISDINMPYLNGIILSQKLLDINEKQQIIIVSAYNDSEKLESLIELGIKYFLHKPIKFNKLVEVLTKVCEKIEIKNKKSKEILKLKNDNQKLQNRILSQTYELKKQTFTDKLTSLKTYNALIKDLYTANYTTIFLISIDEFNAIKRLHGLYNSNTILKDFSKLLNSFNSENKFSLYRINEDQFALLSEECDLELKTKELYEYIDNHEFKLNEKLYLNVTIGASSQTNSLIQTAGVALEFAKNNQLKYKIYDENIDNIENLKNESKNRDILNNAIESDLVFPVFQPIVNRDGKVVKYEVLMRIANIQNGVEEIFFPSDFLDTAIKTKQYNQLSKIIIEKSFEIMKDNDFEFSINLSFRDIYNSYVIEVLEDYLEKYPNIGKRVTIELLESECIEDYKLVNKFINKFKHYGIKVAIDDFGIGYSNLSHILNLNVDYLKIDGSLIKNIDTDSKSVIIVKAILEFAKELNLEVVAEFVHSKLVYETLDKMGIKLFQGYYFSKPIRNLHEYQ